MAGALVTAVEEESQVEPAPPAPRWSWLSELGTPLAVFAASRVAQLLVLAWLNGTGGPSIASKLRFEFKYARPRNKCAAAFEGLSLIVASSSSAAPG